MSKQLEFYFVNRNTGERSQSPVTFDYPEPRRTYSQPATEYFRKAFDVQPLGAPVDALPWEKHDIAKDVKPYVAPTSPEPILSQDSEERKATPIWSGWIQYFPLAHAAAARHSFRMNTKHNPGEPMHWAREKSKDHEDCAARHLVDVNHFNEEIGEYEEACALFWRAGAILQLLEEKRLGRSK